MGQSTDAIVCYGIELGDEGEIPEWVWELAGVKDTRDDPDDDGSSEWKLDEALEKRKLTIVRHCSDACTMFILAAKKSVKEARRGYPESLSLGKMEEDTGVHRYLMHEQLMLVKAKVAKPRWMLCSWWG